MPTHFVQIDVTYEGQFRTRAVHGPSGNSLVTDAPVDNHGRGESFSPTDLVATALGTCMATVMGIFAERHAIDLRGMSVTVKKEMTLTRSAGSGGFPRRSACRCREIIPIVPRLSGRRSPARCMPACIRMWKSP